MLGVNGEGMAFGSSVGLATAGWAGVHTAGKRVEVGIGLSGSGLQ